MYMYIFVAYKGLVLFCFWQKRLKREREREELSFVHIHTHIYKDL